MKARVKATGEIIEVVPYGDGMYIEKIGRMSGRCLPTQELDFDIEDVLDYWDKLLHQYAGMAMQGIVGENTIVKYSIDEVCNMSVSIATALVEKLKEDIQNENS